MPLRWSPLEAPEDALARVRAGDGIAGAGMSHPAGLRRRQGAGRRPALLVIDMSLGFTEPDSPLVCELDERRRGDRRAARRPPARRTSRSSTPRVSYCEGEKATATAFIEKVPVLLTLAAGSRWVEIDPRIAPLAARAGAEQALRVGVLRHLAAEPARAARLRLGDRHRRLDVRLRARDGGRRAPERLSRGRAARGRRRPQPGRARAGARTTSTPSTATCVSLAEALAGLGREGARRGRRMSNGSGEAADLAPRAGRGGAAGGGARAVGPSLEKLGFVPNVLRALRPAAEPAARVERALRGGDEGRVRADQGGAGDDRRRRLGGERLRLLHRRPLGGAPQADARTRRSRIRSPPTTRRRTSPAG